jgi:hypothetical protein
VSKSNRTTAGKRGTTKRSTAKPSTISPSSRQQSSREHGTGEHSTGEHRAGDHGVGEDEASALLSRLLSGPLDAIAAGDPLQAELETSAAMALPRLTGDMSPADADAFISTAMVSAARDQRSPEGAALLRLLMALGSPVIKRKASLGLADLTAAGHFPPDWVNEAGKPTAIQAWRRYDVFGDDEAVAVIFTYGEVEHGIVVQTDLISVPTAVNIAVASDTARLRELVSTAEGPFGRAEEVSLAEARHRIEPALTRSAEGTVPGMNKTALTYLPIARSRIRRLPAPSAQTGTAGDTGTTGQTGPVFTAEDRAAAVADFMRSPQAAEAVAADADATLFWAQVLTGYSSRVPGEPPAQVGPRKLAFILLAHVPDTFPLTSSQRSHLVPAVTAWTQWSAAHREFDEAAATHLTQDLPEIFAQFDGLYDDPGSVADRAYLADLATSDVDVAWLAEQADRLSFAVPMPGHRGSDGLDGLDASDQAARQAISIAEFAGCTPPAGLAREEFQSAVHRIIDEIWHSEPQATWTRAQRMLAEGHSRHDTIHALAGSS